MFESTIHTAGALVFDCESEAELEATELPPGAMIGVSLIALMLFGGALGVWAFQ